MRVIFITEWYPPYSFGGAGTYIERLTEELSKLGVEIHIIAPGSETNSIKERGMFIHRFKSTHFPFLSLPLFVYNYSKDIDKIINNYQIDIVHSNDYVGFPVNCEIPIISTAHHLKIDDQLMVRDLEGRIRFKFVKKLEEKMFEKSKKIICVSNYTSEQLKKFYPKYASKSIVVENGVDIRKYSKKSKVSRKQLTKKFKLDDNARIVFLPGGARGARKGGNFLVDAIPDIIAKNQNTVFVFSGSGWKNTLSRLAKKVGVDKYLVLPGELSEDEIISLYQNSTVICFPSRLEGFGLVVIEAMASKTPIVATAVGEIPNIINNNVNGILLQSQQPVEIAEKINLLLKDDKLRKKLTLNGWMSVQRYTWKRAAKKTFECYKQILQTR